MKKESITQLIERLAPQINATTFIEPIYKRYGIIFFQNGKRLFFKNKRLNINISSTVSVTKNKFETCCFLSYFGYSTPVGKTFSNHPYDVNNNRSVKSGLLFAKKIGFPVILKPNNRGQGFLVCKVNNEEEFYDIVPRILKAKDDYLLIEKFYDNYSDYRIVVLGDKVISAYQRIPLTVIGDGKCTIVELLYKKQEYFIQIGRPASEINIDDFRIKSHLVNQGITLNYIPFLGERIILLDNANLSSGGTTLELTDEIDVKYVQLAISVAKNMNLNLCGIDILAPDIQKWSDDYIILEVNSAPGLDNYAFVGEQQQKNVDSLYLQVLRYYESM